MLCDLNQNPKIPLTAGEWGINFIMDNEKIFEKIVNAADFLDFEVLYDTCKLYFRLITHSMDENEIRERFNLPDDLSAEEKKKIYSIGAYVLKIK